MSSLPCCQRTFLFRLDFLSLYTPYLRWLRRLCERFGTPDILSVWEATFANRQDSLLNHIFSSSWKPTASDQDYQPDKEVDRLIANYFSAEDPLLSSMEAKTLLDSTPPLCQTRHLFSAKVMEKEITAYDALHIRFHSLACLAEALIEKYGKQGELVVYDLMVEGKLASSKDNKVSVEAFIEEFTTIPDTSNLFTAGLELEIAYKSKREAVIYVHQCEWARYFLERHPQVGYLMACSTDEIGYKAINPNLRLQRTHTIMEGGAWCDFRVYAMDEDE